jgi:hypothetical protein
MKKDECYKIENFFDQDIVEFFKKESTRIADKINSRPLPKNQRAQPYDEFREIQDLYGRVCITEMGMPDGLQERLNDLVSDLFNVKLVGELSLGVEYNPKYGTPNLPPHFDGDNTEIILNYQLDSNTSWACGVNTTVFDMEDNSALIFSPNANVHWRPHKKFNEGEFVKMIFFRFYDPTKESDYSHLRLSLNDPVFDDMNELRERLRQ